MDLYLKNFSLCIKNVVPAISDEEIRIFFSKAKKKDFQKGELFVREDEICKHLLFIHKGLFRYYILHEGIEIIKDFAIDRQNPFCTAYTSFMLQKPSQIWVEALEPSFVWSWNREDVLPLFLSHPLWMYFSKLMADKLFYRKEQKELQLIKCSAEERYRLFLAEFPELSQRVPQYQIASYLGIQPESLSRIRSKLAR